MSHSHAPNPPKTQARRTLPDTAIGERATEASYHCIERIAYRLPTKQTAPCILAPRSNPHQSKQTNNEQGTKDNCPSRVHVPSTRSTYARPALVMTE